MKNEIWYFVLVSNLWQKVGSLEIFNSLPRFEIDVSSSIFLKDRLNRIKNEYIHPDAIESMFGVKVQGV